MALLIEKPWRTQPTSVTGLTTASIGDNLVIVLNGSIGPNNLCNAGICVNMVGDVARKTSPAGIGFSGFSSSNYLSFSNPIIARQPASIFMLCQNGNTSDQGFNTFTSNTNSQGQEHMPYSNTIYLSTLAQSRWVSNVAVPGGVNSLLRPFSLCVTKSGSIAGVTSAQYKAFINSIPLTVSATPAEVSVNTAFRIGSNSQSSLAYSGSVFLFAMWKRELSLAEVNSLHSNPWQLFTSQELQLGPSNFPRIYYVAGPNSTWATPTSTQIINGQLSGGGAATASWSESAPLQTTTPFNFSQPASPLTTGTKYRAAAVQKAGDSNVVSNVVESDPFLAGAATLSNPEAVNITDTAATPKVTVSY